MLHLRTNVDILRRTADPSWMNVRRGNSNGNTNFPRSGMNGRLCRSFRRSLASGALFVIWSAEGLQAAELAENSRSGT